jgi:hypothetical protein
MDWQVKVRPARARRNAPRLPSHVILLTMQKLYVYVDEAGQHTEGRVFVVSVVMIDSTERRDQLAPTLETIEEFSRKRKQKWRTSRHEERFAYLTAVLTNSIFKGPLFYQMHFSSRDYLAMTVQTTANAISAIASRDYKATILVDGLPDSDKHTFGVALRRRGIKTRTVRGVDDKKEAFVRLADALCGFIIDAHEGNELYGDFLKQGERTKFVRKLGK